MNNMDWRALDAEAKTVIKDPLFTPKSKEEMNWAIQNDFIIPAFRDGVITVDKLLDHADVVLSHYTPSIVAIDFFNFIRLVLGEEPENNNPPAHYFMIDCLFQQNEVKPYFQVRNIDYDMNVGRTVIMATREWGKSVLLGAMLPLYIADRSKIPGFGNINYGLYISDSMRGNVKTTMETIGAVYRESMYLQNRFEDSTTNQDEVSFTRKPQTKRELALYNEYVLKQGKKPNEVPGRMKRTFSMKGIGAEMGGRGSRDALDRPNMALFDDLISSESNASSPTILENIESTIEKDVLPAMHGTNSIALLIGTPFNKNDPVYKRIESGMWLPVVFPKAEKISIDLKEKDFRGVWPDRHTYKACMRDFSRAYRAQEAGDSAPMRGIMQEYYLRIASEEDRLVPDSLLQWFNADNIVANAWKYNWYITTDYTTTGSKGSDLSGAMLWAVGHEGDWFLIGLTGRKMELEEQYDETFNMVEMVSDKVRWVEVGVEVDGQQNVHIYSLKQKMTKRGTYFSFARQKGSKFGSEGIRSRLEGGNKHWRFRQMLPMFQNHKIWFAEQLRESPDMRELLEEIKYCTYSSINSKHDDLIDCISQVGMIEAQYPSKEATQEDKGHKPIINNPINRKIWSKKHMASDDTGTSYDSYV